MVYSLYILLLQKKRIRKYDNLLTISMCLKKPVMVETLYEIIIFCDKNYLSIILDVFNNSPTTRIMTICCQQTVEI